MRSRIVIWMKSIGNINGNSLQHEESFYSKQDCSPDGNIAKLSVHEQNSQEGYKNSNMIWITSQEHIPEENMS